MGYLLDQMEKLAKETERSFGDKALLAGGAAAGAGIGASAVGAPTAHMLADWRMADQDGFAKWMRSKLANKNALQRALIKSMEGTLIGATLPIAIGSDAIDAYRSSPEKGLKRLMDVGEVGLGWTIGLHRAMPKKIKLMTALGLPVTAAAGYGGYKGAEALLKD